MVDILELKDRIKLLYDRAQLDSDNSELDALKRLASSCDDDAVLLSNTDKILPVSTQLFSSTPSTENLRTENSLQTPAVSTATDRKVKVEETSSEHPVPVFAKGAKLLLIPDTLSSKTKHHSMAQQNHPRVTQLRDVHSSRNCEQQGSHCTVTGLTNRRNVSDGGQKSVPLGDVMNVKLTSAHVSPRSAVSLVPLASISSAPRIHSPIKMDWNQQVKIKQEPGLSCQRAGKRKLSVEHRTF